MDDDLIALVFKVEIKYMLSVKNILLEFKK